MSVSVMNMHNVHLLSGICCCVLMYVCVCVLSKKGRMPLKSSPFWICSELS